MDFLKFQINELKMSNLIVGEKEKLESEYKLIENSSSILENLSKIIQNLSRRRGDLKNFRNRK